MGETPDFSKTGVKGNCYQLSKLICKQRRNYEQNR